MSVPIEALPLAHRDPAALSAEARRSRRARQLAFVGRAALVWLAAYAVLSPATAELPVAIARASALALIWLAGLQLALAAGRITFVVMGPAGATSLGTITGLIGASSLTFWLPALRVDDGELLGMAVSIFILSTAWEVFLERHEPLRRQVLVVGAGEPSRRLVEELADEDVPFDIVGLVDDGPHAAVGSVPVHGRIAELPAVVEALQPDLVVVGVDHDRPQVFGGLLDGAAAGFRVVELPEFYEHVFGRVPVRNLSPAWFVSVLHLYQRPYSRFAKRSFDVVAAALALLLAAPLLLVIALLVRRTPGSVIYRQTRLGEGGRHYTMYKFRSMRIGAEEDGQAIWAQPADPRTTTLGRLLRRTRLDELPQLWNVLKGDMSIVGPRPERPEFLALLEESVPFWSRRHLLKPGITGWAQVRRGYAADCPDAEEKLSYDMWYLRHRSLVVDLVICFKTLPKLLSGSGQ